MTRVARKDTFAVETVGPDTEVRRKVVAGQEVPDHYHDFEDGGAVEDVKGDGTLGYPHEYSEGVGGHEHDYGRAENRGRRGSRSKGAKAAEEHAKQVSKAASRPSHQARTKE